MDSRREIRAANMDGTAAERVSKEVDDREREADAPQFSDGKEPGGQR
jgi:hypothetical protein